MQTAVEIYFVVLWISAASYLVLLLVFITGWLKTGEYQPSEPVARTKVSVVVAARNEEHNLKSLFDSLESQDYPQHLTEIIVVDDHSEDNTFKIIEDYKNKHPDVVALKADGAGKKAALRQGYSAASGQLIVTTDADCTFGKGWLSGLVSFFEEEKPLLMFGPVVYNGEKTFLQKFFSVEFISLVVSGAGSLGMKLPLSGNAANMAFSKSVLGAVQSMKEGEKYRSGDDVFLLHYIAGRYGAGTVRFVKSRQVVVETAPPSGLRDFIEQRIRWGSKAGGYSLLWPKLVALVVFLFNGAVFAAFVAGFFRPEIWILYALLVLMKFLADYPLLKSFSLFAFKNTLIPYIFLFETVYPFYLTLTAVLSMLLPYRWKGRKGLR